MRLKKLADIEALKQLRLIEDQVVNKRDEGLPEKVTAVKGADILYRNLQNLIPLDGENYTSVILDIIGIIKQESIVDWHKNLDVKRKMMNKIDDYLYDVARVEYDLDLSPEASKEVIEKAVQLAENNHKII
ncbi:MAG: hypothetical protein R3B41_00370 [Candidatus Doudnabacteria bacterium]